MNGGEEWSGVPMYTRSLLERGGVLVRGGAASDMSRAPHPHAKPSYVAFVEHYGVLLSSEKRGSREENLKGGRDKEK
ncbi:hypothetical protein Mapa_008818 [Marchantia paleacea]|nr:hypothetical protein Mapa_008818 [Marchantia paleacea]